MTETLTLERIRRAQAGLAGRIHRTPLLGARMLGERTGSSLFLKAECLQKTGSFKVRGVLTRIGELSPEERQRGLIGISAGNHAQALAWAATREGLHATVVMPENATRVKVEASRAYGAEVVLHGRLHESFAKMEELRSQHGFTLVHPFADEAVMAGQGTVGLEIVEDLPDVDVVMVPVGGGALLSGIAAAVKLSRPQARVIGVEPEGAPSVTAALEAGQVVPLAALNTIADGLAAPMTADRVLAHVRRFVDDIITIPDTWIADAMRLILERAKLLAEPAGAAGLAGLLSGRVQIAPGSRVVVVVSGGNIDLTRLKELLP